VWYVCGVRNGWPQVALYMYGSLEPRSSEVSPCMAVSDRSAAGCWLGNNNNDALLSQTWVIAKATVLEVCTVPHVEPYTFG
jgi:hypothetical protein